MTVEEIRKNAPSGATHYQVDGNAVYYYMIFSNSIFIFNKNKGWMKKPAEWIKEAKPLY